MAPNGFYRGLPTLDLANATDYGIASLGRKYRVAMAFRATTFPDDFLWPVGDGDLTTLVRWFDGRTSVTRYD